VRVNTFVWTAGEIILKSFQYDVPWANVILKFELIYFPPKMVKFAPAKLAVILIAIEAPKVTQFSQFTF